MAFLGKDMANMSQGEEGRDIIMEKRENTSMERFSQSGRREGGRGRGGEAKVRESEEDSTMVERLQGERWIQRVPPL